MNYIQTEIEGVWLIEPKVYEDNRGYFFESFNEKDFEQHIGVVNFVQENESKSTFGVLRGLHFQKGEYSQAKLVRVVSGRVLDVAVDLRKSSPTFGQHISVELSAENKRQLFIPRGFAHGYLVLSKEAVFTYKVDNYYAPASEAAILFSDEELKIDWPIAEFDLILSEKDKVAPLFKEVECFS
ncbi:MAG: dTDP-4-dehydrorhamnose 3,5-epimerase [Bacteroidales bacterium]|nr:dTDP-4-dehydrorhamnose 3,5-epimerase [Bacteroidales bacterium]